MGLSINSHSHSSTLDLHHYIGRLQEIQIDPSRSGEDTLSGGEVSQLRILSGQLNWLSTQCRPDLAFSSCHVACSIKNAKIKDVKSAHKVLRRAKGTDYKITYFPLGQPEFWKILCFSDASWGNLPDGGSQGAHLIFIVSEGGVANLLSWQSRRLRRVARSTIAAETLATMTACESALLMSSQIAEIMKCEMIPITLVTDNESLANAVRSKTSVEEKRLRIDLSAL